MRVAWTIAALIMVINGYLLLDFFLSEVKGLLLGFVVCSCTAAYVAFIAYLVSQSGALPHTWVNRIPKGFSLLQIESTNSYDIKNPENSTANSS